MKMPINPKAARAFAERSKAASAQLQEIWNRAIAEGRHSEIENWSGVVCSQCGEWSPGQGHFHGTFDGKGVCFNCAPQAEKDKVLNARNARQVVSS